MAKRERFTTTLDSELLQEIKILAIRNRHSTNDLLEEAISDLLNKYKDKTTKDDQSKQQTLELGSILHEKSSKYGKDGSE